jgi:hypothetical protein
MLTSALCVEGSKYGSLSLLFRTIMVRVAVPVKTGEPVKRTSLDILFSLQNLHSLLTIITGDV